MNIDSGKYHQIPYLLAVLRPKTHAEIHKWKCYTESNLEVKTNARGLLNLGYHAIQAIKAYLHTGSPVHMRLWWDFLLQRVAAENTWFKNVIVCARFVSFIRSTWLEAKSLSGVSSLASFHPAFSHIFCVDQWCSNFFPGRPDGQCPVHLLAKSGQ